MHLVYLMPFVSLFDKFLYNTFLWLFLFDKCKINKYNKEN